MRRADFWKKELKSFIEWHPHSMEGEDPKMWKPLPVEEKRPEDLNQVFTPRKGYRIRFWIEGNLQIEGGNYELEINFNHPHFLILALNNDRPFHGSAFRVLYERIIGFELVMVKE